MGGEKLIQQSNGQTSMGSPPRGRGKVSNGIINAFGLRITPAWAGKRRQNPHRAPLHRDHPRVGGEKFAVWGRYCCTTGSPPRGRGKGYASKENYGKKRITPAWAGKSPNNIKKVIGAQDHPRVGGEKSTL